MIVRLDGEILGRRRDGAATLQDPDEGGKRSANDESRFLRLLSARAHARAPRQPDTHEAGSFRRIGTNPTCSPKSFATLLRESTVGLPVPRSMS